MDLDEFVEIVFRDVYLDVFDDEIWEVVFFVECVFFEYLCFFFDVLLFFFGLKKFGVKIVFVMDLLMEW